jgi:hypothetical protein
MTASTSSLTQDQEFPAAPSPAELDAQYSATASPVVASVEVPTTAELAATQTPVVPDPLRDEAERIEPDVTGPLTLQSGKSVEVVPLKLRETMKLLKIVTRGAGAVLEQLMGELDLNDPAAFAQTLGALVIMSIPEAEDEAVAFIQVMVRPAGFDSLEQTEKISQLNDLMAELYNPELDDVITIVERVVRRESEDIRNLGKRLVTAFKLTQKVAPKTPAAQS